jgi:molecular chaperone DnaK
MNYTIGIDLGTTNSCMAIMKNGNPEVIVNANGERTTPSIVAFIGNEVKVGTSAKNQAVSNAENTITGAKRLIGKKFSDVQDMCKMSSYKIVCDTKHDNAASVSCNDKIMTPQEISSQVLMTLKRDAEAYLGGKVTAAVITVPAYFNDAQRQATKDAGQIAGLEVKRIINEPTAAALAYGLDKSKSGLVAVYDLGGGTFDVSVLDIQDGLFEVKATNGNTHLGGEVIDDAVIEFVCKEVFKKHNVDINKLEKKNRLPALQRIREAAEKAKKELSTNMNYEINLPYLAADSSGPIMFTHMLSRAELEKIATPIVEKTIDPCKKAMSDAGVKTSDIRDIILVGGMTRMPLVRDIVKKIFNREPSASVNPDEAVALGAALQAGILSGEVKDILLLDVIPLSLGIETLGGVMTRLIERNTTVPVKKSQVFSTAADNQPAVSIMVYQGEREMARDNKLLGNFDLSGIPPSPRGVPQIEVTFDVDANSILHVSAKELKSGKEQNVTITSSSNLSKDDIEKLVREAAANAEADKKKRALIDAQNQAESVIYSTEKSLGEYSDKISEEVKTEVNAALSDLQACKDGENSELICEKVEALNKAAMKIGEAIYKQGGDSDQSGCENGSGSDGGTVDGEYKKEE